MEQFFNDYPIRFTEVDGEKLIAEIRNKIDNQEYDVDVLKLLFSCIDLTSLNTTDSAFSIREFCEKVNGFSAQFPAMPNVGAVCVFPVFAPVLKNSLKVNSVNRAVVAGGFPSSQTFTDLKVDETMKAVDFGANEIDMVISVGEFLDENYEFVMEEVRMIKEAAGEAHVKVILETGALESSENIWKASLLAMEGGGDFIKTSTGKIPVSATPEAAYVMLQAIKSFHTKKGVMTGFKPAGGVVTTKDALMYYFLVKEILGEKWLNNKWFRLGASRLANNLLSDIQTIEKGEPVTVTYF
jgi:deoxyribose-phosphate aldolase